MDRFHEEQRSGVQTHEEVYTIFAITVSIFKFNMSVRGISRALLKHETENEISLNTKSNLNLFKLRYVGYLY